MAQTTPADTLNGLVTVTADGAVPMVRNAEYPKMTDDGPGTALGGVSGTHLNACRFMNYSFDVKFEGRSVCRPGEPLLKNQKNTIGYMTDVGEESIGGGYVADISECRSEGDAADVATGKVFKVEQDLRFSYPFPIGLTRNWQSSRSDIPGLFGLGWTSLADQGLWVNPDQIRFADELGEEIIFPAIDRGEVYFLSRKRMQITREEKAISIIPANGNILTFRPEQENALWRLQHVTSRCGGVLKLTYENDRLIQIEDAAGWIYRFAHDTFGRLSEIVQTTSPFEETIRLRAYAFDARNRLVRVLDEFSRAVHYAYDARNLLVKITNRNGGSYHYVYDDHNRCVETFGQNGYGRRRFEYEPSKSRTMVTDSLGRRTTYYHNKSGFVTMVRDAAGGNRQYHYDNDTLLLGEIDENENTRTYRHDGKGRIIETTDAGNHVWKRRYASEGVAETDPEGNTLIRDYDIQGNLTRERSEDGHSRRFRPDPFGRMTPYAETGKEIEVNRFNLPTLKRDGNGNETRYVYDINGRLILEMDPSGKSLSYSYDPEGNLMGIRDSIGNARTFIHEDPNLKTRCLDENGCAIEFEYDTEGQLTTIVNEKGECHRFEYGATGRLQKSIGFDGQILTFKHDRVGNVRKIEVPGGIFELTHDRENRLTGIIAYSEGGNVSQTVFAYDGAGRLVAAVNESGPIRFAYDAFGRIVKEWFGGRETQREYTPRGNLAGIRVNDGTCFHYQYDAYHRVSEIVLPDGRKITHFRDKGGFPAERHFPGGICSKFTHDTAGRLTSQKIIAGENTPVERSYRYDRNGRLTQLTDPIRGSKSFSYDRAGRLRKITGDNGDTEILEYDPAGNILRKNGIHCAGYEKGNRLTVFYDTAMVYDLRGNLIAKTDKAGTHRYEYNLFNQLTCYTGPDTSSIEFTYDALGRRIAKKSGQGEVTYYWDLFTLALEETHDSRTGYGYYPDTYLPLCLMKSEETYYFHTDPIGLPREIFSGKGRMVWSGTYTVNGLCTVDQDAIIENAIRFPGQYYDTETGLHYTLICYYDPETGRYISQRPIFYGGGDLNPYRYGLNDPLNSVDPLGLGSADSILRLSSLFMGVNVFASVSRDNRIHRRLHGAG